MARLVFCVALSLLALTPHAGAAQSAADSVRALDAAWARAYATHDTTLALSLFAPDFVATSTNGGVKDRAGELADVRAQPTLVMDYFRTRAVDVRMHGRTAIVTGLAEWRYTFDGRVGEVRRRYTSVFVPGGPLGWRMAALHVGRAPDP